MAAYYNEFNPMAAHMLRALISDGLIADGDVDERSIKEVRADDLKGYTQCHFFAGIGGWSVALRLAGWGDDRPVWTGSCPCQPFSKAGKKTAQSDKRHLWPDWARLIRERRPAAIFGEQVASAIAYGWWDDVAADMEAENYACAAAVLPACSVGAPHRRERLWFVGYAEHNGQSSLPESRGKGKAIQHYAQGQNCSGQFAGASKPSNVADTNFSNEGGRPGEANGSWEEVWIWAGDDATDDCKWVICPDGKARPVKPRICLLADGVQHRTPLLHGYGNAIVPQVAAEFIKATM